MRLKCFKRIMAIHNFFQRFSRFFIEEIAKFKRKWG
jgi:hypothetical protein